MAVKKEKKSKKKKKDNDLVTEVVGQIEVEKHVKVKSGRGGIAALVFLFVVILGTLAFVIYQNYQNDQNTQRIVATENCRAVLAAGNAAANADSLGMLAPTGYAGQVDVLLGLPSGTTTEAAPIYSGSYNGGAYEITYDKGSYKVTQVIWIDDKSGKIATWLNGKVTVV